jgi:peptidoglycan hydrolase-like protein with peptidoglycan-binding domain
MKRFLFCWLALGLCLGSMRADETVRQLQAQLKQAGFYEGHPTGIYDEETATAVSRYQIRNGLAITGRMDAATLSALRVTPPKSNPTPEPATEAGTWRRLRNGDMQFLQKLNAGEIPPPNPSPSASPKGSVVASSVASKSSNRAVMDPHAPPPPLPEDVAQPTATSVRQPRAGNISPPESADDGKERLQDYVGAFILAGLDPQVEAELGFFAGRVNYFGEASISREKIRADLVRYDERWPQRRFWLAGDLAVAREPGGLLRVTFPLGYELRNGRQSVSGKVRKTLTLRKTSAGDFEIVGVSEGK